MLSPTETYPRWDLGQSMKKVPKHLIPIFEYMLGELEENRLVVKRQTVFEQNDIRVVESENCDWYKEFCEAHPPEGSKKKPTTVIKRRETTDILKHIIKYKKSKSKYLDYLLDVAHDFHNYFTNPNCRRY